MQKNITRRAGLGVLSAALIGMMMIATGGTAAAQDSEPPLKGAFGGNFTFMEPPIPAPLSAFSDDAGDRVTLQDFRGEVVLVNFWATWCAPCVAEMPSLDRLQADLGDEGLRVVAIALDKGGLDVVAPFYEKLGLEMLGVYLDPKGRASREFEIAGLPTSMLVDRRNRIIGILQGAAEWDSPEAKAVIRYYLDQPIPAGAG